MNCGGTRDGRFCEACGHDATKPVDTTRPVSVTAPGEWSALVQADRSWFEEVRGRSGPDVAALEFPQYCPQRRFVLSGAQLTIGRGSRSRGFRSDPQIRSAQSR